MHISITTDEQKKIRLILPLTIIKFNIVLKKIYKNSKLSMDYKEFRIVIKKMLKVLKQFKKNYPNLEILNIDSKNGEKIIIRL